ncbi:MAG TPA: efflux RND transporter permease subunit [Thermoanaerobaculia bacterium]|nr:efflux RND transporter permease subunit [Thermoanaerobaculia bacterium]
MSSPEPPPSSAAAKLLAACIERPLAVAIWALALVFAGAWAAARTPLEWVPSVELPKVTITSLWPGASPRAVERSVTAPIERTLRGVAGTAGIESTSREGLSIVRLEMRGERLGLVLADVSDRLAALRPTLPERVVPRLSHEVPEAFKADQGFMTLELFGPAGGQALRRLASEVVAPQLRSLPGVAGAEVEGGEEEELLVALDPARMSAHRLRSDAVTTRLAEAFTTRTYGRFSGRGRSVFLVGDGLASTAEAGRLPLATAPGTGELVRLADIAQVSLAAAPFRSISRVDGEPAVTIILDRTPGSHLLAVARTVEEALVRARHSLPPGVVLRVADDRSRDVRKTLRSIAVQCTLALSAIALVLALMLRGFRAAAIVLFSVAVTLAVALTLFRPVGLTFNLVTLGGLVLLLGLLVDNATVVVDRLLVERARRPAEAEARALRAVWLSLVGCTGTTVIVFLPMVYLTGELHSLFAPFAAVATITLAFSLVTAGILVPVLGRFLPQERQAASTSQWRRFVRKARTVGLAPYRLAGRHPRTTLAAFLLVIGLPTPLLPTFKETPEEGWTTPGEERDARRFNETLGREEVRRMRRVLDPLVGGVTRPFLSGVDVSRALDTEESTEVQVVLRLPPGSGIEHADELVRGFERRAVAGREVERTIARIGEDISRLRVIFPREALDRPGPYAVRETLVSEALKLAGVEASVSGLVPTGFYSGLGSVSGLRVEAYGPGWDALDQLAQQLAARLARDPRVAGVDLDAGRGGRQPGREVLRLRWGPQAVAETSLPPSAVAALLRARLFNLTPTLVVDLPGRPRLPLRIVTAGADRQDWSDLLAVPLDAGDRRFIRLADLAQVSDEREPPAIERKDQRYARFLEVFYRGPSAMGYGLIDRTINTLPMLPGYKIERPKATTFSREDKLQLFGLIAASIGLVFLVIAAVLESWRLAAWVMLSVPLAWVGIALAFVASGQDFTEGAFMGVVLAIGIAVKDSILLADRFHRLEIANPETPARRLVLAALADRMRPMWATTWASIAGMLPALVLHDAGAFWVGLALAVVGGLLGSTLLAPAAMVAFVSWREGSARPQPA